MSVGNHTSFGIMGNLRDSFPSDAANWLAMDLGIEQFTSYILDRRLCGEGIALMNTSWTGL